MKVSKVATVVSTKRLNNSSMGNPAWEFTFNDGSTHRTSSNASFSYEVTESNFNGQMVNVYMTRAGRIIDMRMNKVRFNTLTTPYKYAKAGESLQVFITNLEEAEGPKEFEAKGCEYTFLPSADGDENGLMVEWYENLGMWTVFHFNTKSPHLRQYQVRYSSDLGDHVVVDTHNGDKVVGRTQTEEGARIMARKRNQSEGTSLDS